jgi:hypothetical protein
MTDTARHVTTAPDALERARAQGFIEAVFPRQEVDPAGSSGDTERSPVDLWGDECCVREQHIIILGARVPEADHFVSIFFHYTPGWEGALKRMYAVFVRHYGEGPRTEVEESMLVWTSPARSRETALALARDLVALNRGERDPTDEVSAVVASI